MCSLTFHSRNTCLLLTTTFHAGYSIAIDGAFELNESAKLVIILVACWRYGWRRLPYAMNGQQIINVAHFQVKLSCNKLAYVTSQTLEWLHRCKDIIQGSSRSRFKNHPSDHLRPMDSDFLSSILLAENRSWKETLRLEICTMVLVLSHLRTNQTSHRSGTGYIRFLIFFLILCPIFVVLS